MPRCHGARLSQLGAHHSVSSSFDTMLLHLRLGQRKKQQTPSFWGRHNKAWKSMPPNYSYGGGKLTGSMEDRRHSKSQLRKPLSTLVKDTRDSLMSQRAKSSKASLSCFLTSKGLSTRQTPLLIHFLLLGLLKCNLYTITSPMLTCFILILIIMTISSLKEHEEHLS